MRIYMLSALCLLACSRAPASLATTTTASGTAPSASASVAPPASADGSAPSADPLRSLALAPGNVCELTASGQVSCGGDWSINTETSDSFGGKNQDLGTMIAVGGLGKVRSIAIANNRGCDIEQDGTVRCWGNTHASRRGWTGAKPRAFDADVAAGIDHVTSLAITSGHSCALRDDHKVICWGPPFARTGKLTDPIDPPRVIATDPIAQVSGGDFGTYCAVTLAGAVVCWGRELSGGWGSDVVRAVPGLSDVAEVSVGLAHACARKRSGEVSCWGDNTNGQLGDATLAAHAGPVSVGGVSGAVAIDVSSAMSCALTSDAHVYCWGEDINCALGDAKKVCTTRTMRGTTGSVDISYCGPSPIATHVAAKHLAVGSTQACVWDDAGAAECWGLDPVKKVSSCTPSAPP